MVHSQTFNVEYQKYSGAGNKFAILDATGIFTLDKAGIVEELVKENPEIDGVIFVQRSDIADFHMNYFNKDGTGNALCGNGLRCTAKYIYDNKMWNRPSLELEAVGEIFRISSIGEDKFSVLFPQPKFVNIDIPLMLNTDDWLEQINFSYVDVGSPHVVIFVSEMKHRELTDLEKLDVNRIGKMIRYHREFMPEGTNVNFVEITGEEFKIRSYERGVESETLACGTGALSSAVVAALKFGVNPPVHLRTRSGDILTADFDVTKGIENLSLIGPAERYQK